MRKPEFLFSSEDKDIADRWHIDSRGYARRTTKQTPEWAHKLVCERIFGFRPKRGDKIVIDHKNRNKLDNRRINIRIVTCTQNSMNCGVRAGRGTCWIERDKLWQARVKLNGKTHYAGAFRSRKAAAKAAKQKRIELGFVPEAI